MPLPAASALVSPVHPCLPVLRTGSSISDVLVPLALTTALGSKSYRGLLTMNEKRKPRSCLQDDFEEADSGERQAGTLVLGLCTLALSLGTEPPQREEWYKQCYFKELRKDESEALEQNPL